MELCLIREYENNGIAALVKVKQGAKVPSHNHFGDEESYIIEGKIDIGSGKVAQAGDYVLMEKDENHELIALEDTLFFVTIHKGFEWT
ncbi:cupin domain-containing protein [Nodosilinea sp. P-1105]|nr:cupin domain-containing protein [Nodosilinea sp. P-1105]